MRTHDQNMQHSPQDLMRARERARERESERARETGEEETKLTSNYTNIHTRMIEITMAIQEFHHVFRRVCEFREMAV
jgi:hypothetical protein